MDRIVDDISILIGGKAGFGIDTSSDILARILSNLGRRVYVYREYPSLIRGGHTYSLIRGAREKVGTHSMKVDFLVALNQETVDLHREKLKEGALAIFDSDSVKADGIGIPAGRIIKEENAPEIMRNTCLIGAFSAAAGIEWEVLEKVFRKKISKEIELNLKVARRGYDERKGSAKILPLAQDTLPVFTGNEAIGLGLLEAGLRAYIAYPMTPSSGVLHFLSSLAGDLSLKVIHPESEIAVIMMALGFTYCGTITAVGTSGGGFCLMTEGLSLSGMAELPVVIVLGMRPGPSTGLPTYTAQTELRFALNAGQGEFSRFVVAPGDAEEACYWSAAALKIAWKYQIPSIVLVDKTLCEGAYSFDRSSIGRIEEAVPAVWDRQGLYKRYRETPNGVSPLAFAPDRGAIVKVNSYEHDESGITTEDPATTKSMAQKRLRKAKYLSEEIGKDYQAVKTYGNRDAKTALLMWGSNKGVCVEIAGKMGLRVIQPIVLSPFPSAPMAHALEGVEALISVENNATAQMAELCASHGIRVDRTVLKYDGRPFSLDDLEDELGRAMR